MALREMEIRPAAGRGPATAKFRRRPPSPTEQARRVAWGKKWGQVLSEHAKLYDRKR